MILYSYIFLQTYTATTIYISKMAQFGMIAIQLCAVTLQTTQLCSILLTD